MFICAHDRIESSSNRTSSGNRSSPREEGRGRWNERKRRGVVVRTSGEWILSGLIRTYKDTGSLCALNETREAPCKGILRDLVNRSKGATVCYPSKARKREKTGKIIQTLDFCQGGRSLKGCSWYWNSFESFDRRREWKKKDLKD